MPENRQHDNSRENSQDGSQKDYQDDHQGSHQSLYNDQNGQLREKRNKPNKRSRPPGDTNRALGTFGESFAAAHLMHQGYRIIARQWRCERGEIDIIARDGDELVFVEVRTRRSRRFGTPEDSITRAKQDRLIELSLLFLQEYDTNDDDPPWRIDVIALDVDRTGQVSRLNHIPYAIEQ
jgi:putative endonuclease